MPLVLNMQWPSGQPVFTVFRRSAYKTGVNSNKSQHFHIPIPNAKVATTLEITAFPVQPFPENAIFGVFLTIFVRWVPPYFFYVQNAFFFFGSPTVCRGRRQGWLKPPQSGLRHTTALPDRRATARAADPCQTCI